MVCRAGLVPSMLCRHIIRGRLPIIRINPMTLYDVHYINFSIWRKIDFYCHKGGLYRDCHNLSYLMKIKKKCHSCQSFLCWESIDQPAIGTSRKSIRVEIGEIYSVPSVATMATVPTRKCQKSNRLEIWQDMLPTMLAEPTRSL